jgi:two-component system, cell cycle response regulator DivK
MNLPLPLHAPAPRVLVVDDNPLNAELALAVLSADGLAVEVAADATEAALRMAEFRPDLVLMDIQLPGVDGLTLTRQIKADPATRHVVVLAFTAYAMKGDEARMLEAGCDGYVSKPIDVASLAAQVRARLPRL